MIINKSQEIMRRSLNVSKLSLHALQSEALSSQIKKKMEAQKFTCLKLELPIDGSGREPVFVKGTWITTRFDLSVTNGLEAWTCHATEEEVQERASQWDQTVSDYVDLAERYLGFQQPGSVYGFSDAGNGCRRLVLGTISAAHRLIASKIVRGRGLSCSHLTTMSRSTSVTMLSRRVCWPITEKTQLLCSKYSTMMHFPNHSLESPKDRIKNDPTHFQCNNSATSIPHQIGGNVPRKDKITFLVNTLMDLKDSKEVVYSTLDAWVAWERNFPVAALKNVLLILEKDQQWHRMIQVIKWMLSKGQGNTRGTYGQLIQALDMDDRAEEAYEIWKKKLAFDLHSVPWKLCNLMISIYYRNNRLEDLVKLFKGLEEFDRKPPEKSIVRKVADAYEILGKPEEKKRILEKCKDLFTGTANGKAKKHGYSPSHKRKLSKKG